MSRNENCPPHRLIIAAVLMLMWTAAVGAKSGQPYLYVLGVAQDAGYPQAGCFQAHCMPGWEDRDLRIGATSLALIDPPTGRKYLFEATPDIPEQLYQLEKETGSKGTPLDGVFITHAHIGHYAGLMFLGHEAMGASGVPVHAMPKMAGFLADNGPWSQLVEFGNIEISPLVADQPVALGTLEVTPFRVPHRDEFSETVGYRIQGPDKSALFIPDINKWSDWDRSLPELVRNTDYALIDATFFADGELPGRDMSQVKHPFVVESMRLLDDLSEKDRAKVWFIHLNHTNPLLDTDSEQSLQVKAAGFNVATEGLRLGL